MSKSRRIAILGLLTALCFALSYIELLLPIPAFGVPGIKLGLANLCVMAALYTFGAKEAAAINLIRIALNWLIFGNFAGFIYSLAGGFTSFAAMYALKKTDRFSPVGVSAAAGASHNIGQLIAAAFLTDAAALGYYLPVLLIAGVATGTFNGIILTAILRICIRKGKNHEQKS